MDDGGGEIDHRFEAAVCLVASHCYAFEFLQLAEEILDQVAPFVDLLVDVERLGSPLMLRDDDLGLAFVQVFDDPVGIKSLVGDQATEFDIFDQRRDADGVEAVAGQKDKPHQIPERVGQREDFGGPATLRLADGLILGPPFAPCAWR
jgi:hypothetical protein